MRCPCFIGTASFSQQENDVQNRTHRAVSVSQNLNCCEWNLSLFHCISLLGRKVVVILSLGALPPPGETAPSLQALQLIRRGLSSYPLRPPSGLTYQGDRSDCRRVKTLSIAKESTWETTNMYSFIQRRKEVRKKKVKTRCRWTNKQLNMQESEGLHYFNVENTLKVPTAASREVWKITVWQMQGKANTEWPFTC